MRKLQLGQRQARVCIIDRFDAAHRLKYHTGHCRRQHGHTYQVELECEGTINDFPGESDHGMVVDFGDVKRVYREAVHNVLDHQDLNKVLRPTYPSAENLAWWIFAQLWGKVRGLWRVRVWEQIDRSYVEVDRQMFLSSKTPKEV